MLERFYTHSDAQRSPLRVGVLLDTTRLYGPFAEVLRQIRDSNFAGLELAVFNAEAGTGNHAGPHRNGFSRRLELLRDPGRRRGLLFEYYDRWDRRHHPEAARLFDGVDCSDLLAGVDRLEVTPVKRGFTHRFPPEALAAIWAKDLDVMLRFGFNILRGDVLRCARYGVWSYHHGDNEFYRGGPACFWELYEGSPVSGVILQVLTEELDGGRVLCKACTATEPGISLVENRVRAYTTGIPFVLRKLWELHQFGWEHLERRMIAPVTYKGRRSPYRKPTNLEVVRFLAPRLARKAWRRARHPSELTYHWRIALRLDARRRLAPEGPADFAGFRWIDPPRGHAYADPCLMTKDGKTWVFFEDYVYPENRGTIACAEVLAGGSLSDPIRVIDLPHHVSYPFVFEDRGEIFMIPETGRDGTVKLFRATVFPHKWEFEKTLFEGRAVDTTLLRHDGVYWFFTSVLDRPGASHCLLLFSAESLTSAWRYHPANPISTDIRDARSAGAIFRHDGRLIRPAQDGSVRYGHAIRFQEIVTLNPFEYREERLAAIDPSWTTGLSGTHTYSRCETAEALDGSVLVARRSLTGSLVQDARAGEAPLKAAGAWERLTGAKLRS